MSTATLVSLGAVGERSGHITKLVMSFRWAAEYENQDEIVSHKYVADALKNCDYISWVS